MIQHIDIANRIWESLAEAFPPTSRYRVSFDALSEIMGVPVAAVRSIACVNDVDCQGEWIEEDSLGVYEDAYIRKLKTYFKRMMRHASEMGYSDLRTFIDFCKTFKKPNIDYKSICCWDDIDEDAIREQFRLDVEKVAKPSKRERAFFSLLAGFDGIGVKTETSKCVNDSNSSFMTVKADELHRSSVLRLVTRSAAYLQRKGPKTSVKPANRQIRGIVISAHYHIYCRKDKDDHHEDALNENAISTKFNSTLMMNSPSLGAQYHTQ